MAGNPRRIALEPAAQAFVDATSEPPFLYQLPPEEGRKTVDQVQDAEIFKPEVEEEWLEVAGGPTGTVKVRVVRPAGSAGTT
ncbi:esterase, partial [Streptomyces olivaceoviridis]